MSKALISSADTTPSGTEPLKRVCAYVEAAAAVALIVIALFTLT